MWIKSGLSAVVFARSIRSAEPLPLPQPQPNAACKNHTTKKNKKKLDISPRPMLQYKNEVEREKKFKCCEKRLDISLKTLYNESVDVFKWD